METYAVNYLKACLDGSVGPQVGAVPRLGEVPSLSISLFSFTVFTWEVKYPPRWVARSAGVGDLTLAGVTFLPVNAWGGVPWLPGVRFIRGTKVQICIVSSIVLVH